MAARFDAVFVGAATLDALALVDGFPGPDERVVAKEISYAGGGPAATAAVAASRLGLTTAFVGTVGDDANGRTILDGLEAEGVNVSGATMAKNSASAASVVIVDLNRGTRAICNRPGPALDLSASLAVLEAAGIIHVDHVGWLPVDAVLRELTGTPLLSVDAGNPIPGLAPQRVGLYVPTVAALRRSHGPGPVAGLLDLAVAQGFSTVVATDGDRGSYALTDGGESAFAPAACVDVVSTLGAGDVFHGALIAAWVRQLSLEDALSFANVTAALSCRGLDGRSRIPGQEEVLGLMSTTSP